jgi:hypothetical protein
MIVVTNASSKTVQFEALLRVKKVINMSYLKKLKNCFESEKLKTAQVDDKNITMMVIINVSSETEQSRAVTLMVKHSNIKISEKFI